MLIDADFKKINFANFCTQWLTKTTINQERVKHEMFVMVCFLMPIYIINLFVLLFGFFCLDLREIHWFWQGRKHGRRWWRPSSISTDHWQSLGAGFKVQLNYFLFCINENGPGLQNTFVRPFGPQVGLKIRPGGTGPSLVPLLPSVP